MTTTMLELARERIPFPPGAGFEWRIFRDRDWRLFSQGRACRYTIGPNHRTCKRPEVARLKRGSWHGGQWWSYCELHLYGRFIYGGQMLELRMREIDTPLEEPDFVARVA